MFFGQTNFVELRHAKQFELSFFVKKHSNAEQPLRYFNPGSKVAPATLYASCQENTGRYEPLLVQEPGSSQCSLGNNARVSVIGDELTIFTDIRTPGFSGRYDFLRQR